MLRCLCVFLILLLLHICLSTFPSRILQKIVDFFRDFLNHQLFWWEFLSHSWIILNPSAFLKSSQNFADDIRIWQWISSRILLIICFPDENSCQILEIILKPSAFFLNSWSGRYCDGGLEWGPQQFFNLHRTLFWPAPTFFA